MGGRMLRQVGGASSDFAIFTKGHRWDLDGLLTERFGQYATHVDARPI
jgi:hypothetical protein